MGLLEMTLLKFYTYIVESSEHDSWPVRTFSSLATGPLKCAPCAASLDPLKPKALKPPAPSSGPPPPQP